MDEGRCAKLVKMAMDLGPLGGAIVVDEGYSDEEIRVADATVKRERGDRFAVVRGRIVMTGIDALEVYTPDQLRAAPRFTTRLSTLRRST